jgi:hypothetical protein
MALSLFAAGLLALAAFRIPIRRLDPQKSDTRFSKPTQQARHY